MTDDINTNWSADHLRVSIFSNAVWVEPVGTIFLNVFGYNPETITQKMAANEASAIGVWDELKLEVKVAFNRIDFVVQSPPSETEPVPLIKNANSIWPNFSYQIAKWASTQNQVLRIALGCNAFLPTQSNEDSYAKLKDLIKVINVDVDKFREFRFQVNLPVVSSVSPDTNINRLSNWASVTLRAALLNVDNPQQYFDDKYYVSCSLDVNTDSDRIHPFKSGLAEQLTEEMSKICINMLDMGIS